MIGFIVGHFDVWLVGRRAVGFRVGGGGLLFGFAGLALLVLCGGFFEEAFAVAFDGLLVFFADLGWIGDALLLVIAFDELLGGLDELVRYCKWRMNEGAACTYLFGKPLQIFLRNLVPVLIHNVLDGRVQLKAIGVSITFFPHVPGVHAFNHVPCSHKASFASPKEASSTSLPLSFFSLAGHQTRAAAFLGWHSSARTVSCPVSS